MVSCFFFTNFADVNELERHIEILLLSNDCVIVPDFGGFMAHHVDAHYDGRDSMFLPPVRSIGFNPQLKINDSLLTQSYVEAYDISYPEAVERLANEVAELKQRLANDGNLELSNIGMLSLNEDGNYTFEPCEAGTLTPAYYGLGGFDMLPLSQLQALETETTSANVDMEVPNSNSIFDVQDDEEASNHTEFVLIKKSWLRNIAAACIAIIAFFAVSTPLRTPNLQSSKVDTGLLTRIMPKELTKENGEQRFLLNKESKDIQQVKEIPLAKEELLKNGNNASQSDKAKELKSDKPYYSIVLASRITKRNAANYVETLLGKGLKDVKVVITPSNVKVAYGTYKTESQAYKALNNLRRNEVFADSWVTKVTD